ncbi:MAG: hypothetical protein U0792_09720 [Gemmataceae bacterium]
MSRSVLVWGLMVAFLATVPVTGGRHCACHFIKAPQTAPDAPLPRTLQPCKPCCKHHPAASLPDHHDHEGEPVSPAESPCDHPPVVDTAPPVVSERGTQEEFTGVVAFDELLVGLSARPTAGTTSTPPLPDSSLRDPLRYSHAFRS